MTIDPTSHEPRYRQLARLLRERIDAGDYRPGQRLPSEERLEQIYGLGRNAVRDALRILKAEGVVRTVTGSGSYVRGRQEVTMVRVTSGAVIATRMPTAEERQALGLDEGVALFVVERPGQEPEVLAGDRTTLIVE
ncbi:DNA-binding GntR family transcriptional regulator [Streptosporangium album]|uniref:DNA-binding GntR family transcriptional regulator n=1 Tax=Streptosporangium album TaxID=47479 RepID=A0A7W7S049_9ACTN|nr:GntR family transcriptional regulator [Streptosporangium album]MBB4940793.1 DNA-binding GntR family transcriptional regulator [Streptosporangium album]